MRTVIGVFVILSAFSFGGCTGSDPMKGKEASPSMSERLSKETVNGTLMRTSGEYYVIKDNDGKEHKVHVDKSTKLDKVVEGDLVKAYLTDKGHVTTLQRVQ